MVKKIAEKFNRLSRVHQRHRQQTDRQTTDGIATPISKRNVIRSRLLIKTPLFHGACLNMFSFRWLYIPSSVLYVHAFPVMLAFVEHKYLPTYLHNMITLQNQRRCNIIIY